MLLLSWAAAAVQAAAAAEALGLPPGVAALTPWGALLSIVVGVYLLIATGKLIPSRTHDAIVTELRRATTSAEQARDEWRGIALAGTTIATRLAESSSVAAEVLQKADRMKAEGVDDA